MRAILSTVTSLVLFWRTWAIWAHNRVSPLQFVGLSSYIDEPLPATEYPYPYERRTRSNDDLHLQLSLHAEARLVGGDLHGVQSTPKTYTR